MGGRKEWGEYSGPRKLLPTVPRGGARAVDCSRGLKVEPAMQLIIVSSARYYRKLAGNEVNKTDLVLEVGCSTGETTRILAQRASRVVALDHSRGMVTRTRETIGDDAGVEVCHLDGRDLKGILDLIPKPDVIFLDMGGTQLLGNTAAILRSYLHVFNPRLYVVRSIELAALSSLITEIEEPDDSPLYPTHPPTPLERRRSALQHLLDLSHSDMVSSRLYAARQLRVFGDEQDVHKRLTELAEDPSPTVRRAAKNAPT